MTLKFFMRKHLLSSVSFHKILLYLPCGANFSGIFFLIHRLQKMLGDLEKQSYPFKGVFKFYPVSSDWDLRMVFGEIEDIL